VLHLAWRGVRHNLGRYVATLIAIMTGVAFFTATGFVADRVIDALEGDADRQFSGIDAAIVVDTSPTADTADFADQLRIGGTTADEVAALPEVEAIAGDLTGSVAFLADDGSTFADNATGRLWVEDDDLNPVDIVDGTAPVGDGQIAVDRGLADEHGLAVGDDVTILTLGGEFPATSSASPRSATAMRSTRAARCRSRPSTPSTGSTRDRSSSPSSGYAAT
jgi:putative ABC transport system permease protein